MCAADSQPATPPRALLLSTRLVFNLKTQGRLPPSLGLLATSFWLPHLNPWPPPPSPWQLPPSARVCAADSHTRGDTGSGLPLDCGGCFYLPFPTLPDLLQRIRPGMRPSGARAQLAGWSRAVSTASPTAWLPSRPESPICLIISHNFAHLRFCPLLFVAPCRQPSLDGWVVSQLVCLGLSQTH